MSAGRSCDQCGVFVPDDFRDESKAIRIEADYHARADFCSWTCIEKYARQRVVAQKLREELKRREAEEQEIANQVAPEQKRGR